MSKSVAMDRSLWPTRVETPDARVATTVATDSDSVAIDVCDLLVTALVRCKYTDQESQAALFRMSRKNYQKAITTTPNYDAYGSILKRLGQVPPDVLKEFAGLLAERVGLSHGIDHELVQSSIQLARSIQRVMKLEAR